MTVEEQLGQRARESARRLYDTLVAFRPAMRSQTIAVREPRLLPRLPLTPLRIEGGQ